MAYVFEDDYGVALYENEAKAIDVAERLWGMLTPEEKASVAYFMVYEISLAPGVVEDAPGDLLDYCTRMIKNFKEVDV